MTRQFIPNAVTLLDVGKAAKMDARDVESAANALQLEIGVNWRGDASLSVEDAHGFLDGSIARAASERQTWTAHVRESENWTLNRGYSMKVAGERAWTRTCEAGLGEPAAAAAQQVAMREAAMRYEREHPLPVHGPTGASYASRLYPDQLVNSR